MTDDDRNILHIAKVELLRKMSMPDIHFLLNSWQDETATNNNEEPKRISMEICHASTLTIPSTLLKKYLVSSRRKRYSFLTCTSDCIINSGVAERYMAFCQINNSDGSQSAVSRHVSQQSWMAQAAKGHKVVGGGVIVYVVHFLG
jgi:hypothetical protein